MVYPRPQIMKNLLLSAILGLAAVAVTPALSQAGTFGLFTGCGCCCNSCTFCVRPYNAFTPVCSGNITCMGCMPFACPGYGCPGYGYPAPYAPDYSTPVESEGGACCGTPEADGKVIGDNNNLPPLPKVGQPEPLPNPTQQPAVTTPAQSMRQVNPYGTVQAGYRPVYVPTYNPYGYYNYYAPMGQTPYYWNAK